MTDRGDADTVERKAGGEEGARENAVAGVLERLGKDSEGGQPYSLVQVECAVSHFSPFLREGRPLSPRGAVKCKSRCWPQDVRGWWVAGEGMGGGRGEPTARRAGVSSRMEVWESDQGRPNWQCDATRRR